MKKEVDLGIIIDRVCALTPVHAGAISSDNKSLFALLLADDAAPVVAASGTFRSADPPRLVEMWPTALPGNAFGAFTCDGDANLSFVTFGRSGEVFSSSLASDVSAHLSAGQFVTSIACTSSTLAVLAGGALVIFGISLATNGSVALHIKGSTGGLKGVAKNSETALISISPTQEEVIVGCHSRASVHAVLVNIRRDGFGQVLGSASCSCHGVRAWCADWRSRRLAVATEAAGKQEILFLSTPDSLVGTETWQQQDTKEGLVDFIPGPAATSCYLQAWRNGLSVHVEASGEHQDTIKLDAALDSTVALCVVEKSILCATGSVLHAIPVPPCLAIQGASSFESLLKGVAGRGKTAPQVAEVVAWLRGPPGPLIGIVIRDAEYWDGSRHSVLDQTISVTGKRHREQVLQYFLACASIAPRSVLRSIQHILHSKSDEEPLVFAVALCSIPHLLEGATGAVAAARNEVQSQSVAVLLRCLQQVLLIALGNGELVTAGNAIHLFDAVAVAHAEHVASEAGVSDCVRAVSQIATEYAHWALTDVATGIGAVSARCGAETAELPKECTFIPVGVRRVHTRTVFGIHREMVPLPEHAPKTRTRAK